MTIKELQQLLLKKQGITISKKEATVYLKFSELLESLSFKEIVIDKTKVIESELSLFQQSYNTY